MTNNNERYDLFTNNNNFDESPDYLKLV